MTRVFFARSTAGNPDPRASRVVNVLVDLGVSVDLACWKRDALEVWPDRPQQVEVHVFDREAPHGGRWANLAALAAWQAWLIRKASTSKPDLLYACDLDSAVSLASYSRVKSVPLVFDQFDPYSSRVALRPLMGACDLLEKLVSVRAASVVVASPERALGLGNGPTWVVRNVPSHPITGLSASQGLGLTLFYGGVLHPDRGIDVALRAVETATGWRLDVVGFGPSQSWIEAQELLGRPISFRGRMSHVNLLKQMAGSRAVLATYDPAFPQNRKTASGKLHEAAALGVPLVVSRGTVLGDLVTEHGLGWAVTFGDHAEMADCLVSLRGLSQTEQSEMEGRLLAFSCSHGWTQQREQLLGALAFALGGVGV